MRGQHFYSSDPHFGDERMIEISQRPFSCAAEADEAYVERWNAMVGPNDLTWMLGDVTSDTGPSKHIARLNGTKYLIAGNHDTCSKLMTPNDRERERITRTWIEAGFKGVVDGAGIEKSGVPVKVQLPGGRTVWLSHFPFDLAPWEVELTKERPDPFVSWRPKRPKKGPSPWLIHGHVHQAWVIRGTQFNVGVDPWQEPVPAELIAEMIDAEESAAG